MSVNGPLLVTVERRPTGPVVLVDGELDISGDEQLRRTLLTLVAEEDCPVVLDLTNLRFCDVPGIRVLVDFARAAAEHGVEVEIRGATGQVARMLDLTQVRGVLPLGS